MAANDYQSTSWLVYPSANTNQSEPSIHDNTRAEMYKETSSKWFAILMIIVSICLLITCIVLAIVLATKLKSTEGSTSSTTRPTPSTTKPTDPEPQPFILKCEPDMLINFSVALHKKSKKKAGTSQEKNQQKKMKLPLAPERIGNSILLKNTYMVEYPADVDVRKHFRTITQSLRASNQIVDSEIKIRNVIRSSLFNGASFTVTTNNSIEASKIVEDAIDIRPVYLVPAPRVFKSAFSSEKSIDTDSYLINALELTGVSQVHKQFQNFGRGVRVAVIDSGIDYSHPALGGCFGPGCKVAFGYDFVGDKFGIIDQNTVPDNDPMDNCSANAHGTHVAGIIATNITGITNTAFIPSVPFSGVAPDVTLGAYRVFGCPSNYGTSDVITAAIYRAYEDKADIITISLGSVGAYTETPQGIAIDRVSDMGVYVTVSMGNDGDGGLQTGNDPALSPGAMAVGSVDNSHTLQNIIIAPDGYQILYDAGSMFGLWTSIFNSTIVVIDPNGTPVDDCSILNKSVNKTVVLFAFSNALLCDSYIRCQLAAAAGALGCLLYNAEDITGAYDIPSGSISLKDGLRIVSTVTANPTAVYTFTNLLHLASVKTSETPSWFSSYGLSGDLLPKPQIMGIGGKVYSTISTASAQESKWTKPYAIMSGTSMATPYVAGVLALFLSHIGNPAPITISGYAENGKCRPKFSLAMNIFQSTSKITKIYNSSLFATTAHQGAGLVNAFQALTATTIFSPSELGLNDTVRRASSYKISVINIGTKQAVYKMSHHEAALATGLTPFDEQHSPKPLFSADYADVTIEPSEFVLQPGKSREITLRFRDPSQADPALLPIYSGFIYATNQVNGEVAHMFYGGVVGDYGNARIFVRNSTSGIRTGIQDWDGTFISDRVIPILNATRGLDIQLVLAWSTRMCLVEVVPAEGNVLVGFDISSGFVYFNNEDYTMPILNVPRNIPLNLRARYAPFYSARWYGQFVQKIFNGSSTVDQINRLNPGRYQIKFLALKHFGNPLNPNDFDVYRSPPFGLAF